MSPHAVFMDRLNSRFKVFHVSEVVANRAAQLPDPFHSDPLDRMIAATAVTENCAAMGRPQRFRGGILPGCLVNPLA
jgi:PIN domain nuclease of toxin-antitoxin system